MYSQAQMDKEILPSSSYTRKGGRNSRDPSSKYHPTRSRRILKPNELFKPGGAQETIKQIRIQRTKAKFQHQIFRLMLIAIPLGLILIFTEGMRQRALSDLIKDVEAEVNSTPNVNVHSSINETEVISLTIQRYPFNRFANVSAPMTEDQTGFFWQIPRSGGSTLKEILGKCLNLVQASRTSSEVCSINSSQEKLKICKTHMGAFVNCDPSDDHGIQRCRNMKLIPSGIADVVVSSRFLHVASMFDSDHQARAFTIMRDPIERMISTFYYLHNATWEREYSAQMESMTLLEFAQSEATPSNWMVRFLTGRMTKATMTPNDLAVAKEILEQKVFVILTKDIDGGVEKLLQHMRYKVSSEGRNCIQNEVKKLNTRMNYLHVDMSSPAVEILKERNKLDMELFDFAMKLFTRQWKTIL